MTAKQTSIRAFLGCLLLLFAMGCGPNHLTPDEVRELLAHPTGNISKDTVGFVARDFFKTRTASTAEQLAFGMKTEESGKDSTHEASNEIVSNAHGGALEQALHAGVARDMSDFFCAAGFTSTLANFTGCEGSKDCDVDLVLDACILRMGEKGDANAKGSIHIELKNETVGDVQTMAFLIEFNGFEHTHSNNEFIVKFEGAIGLQTVSDQGENTEEVIFSSDFGQEHVDIDPPLLQDGVLWRSHFMSAFRFFVDSTAGSESGVFEILSSADENGDLRTESVALSFEASNRQISSSQTLSELSINVRGANGNFSCLFESSTQSQEANQTHYQSQGECSDEDGTETFSFESEVTEEN